MITPSFLHEIANWLTLFFSRVDIWSIKVCLETQLYETILQSTCVLDKTWIL